MSPPLVSPTEEEVRAVCPNLGPVGKAETLKMEDVEQPWENLAPRLGTQTSGLFNLNMDLTSGTGILDNGMDNGRLTTVDQSLTSTVDLAELFPDLTEIFSSPALAPTGLAGGEEAPSPLTTEEGIEEGTSALMKSPHSCPPCDATSVVVIDAGWREQLPSTSSCNSEASDYEDGLSPAEVDSALEHFFNEFIDLSNMVNKPAESAGPIATVDAATVRSLIDTPTTGNDSSLLNLPDVPNGSPACSTPSASKRVKIEENEEAEQEEENATCHVPKKARTTKKPAANPDDMYRQRRMKNNMACKRARQNRKKRDSDLTTTAKALEEENALLRAKIEELTEIAVISRKALIEAYRSSHS